MTFFVSQTFGYVTEALIFREMCEILESIRNFTYDVVSDAHCRPTDPHANQSFAPIVRRAIRSGNVAFN